MKKIHRLFSLVALIVALSLCFSFGASAASLSFSDVPKDAWYRDELAFAVEKGMINGTSSTTFTPSGTLTRAQFVAILGRAMKASGLFKENSGGLTFSDVPKDAYYAKELKWATANGIVNGTSSTTFSPDSPVTREAVMVMMARTVRSFKLTNRLTKDSSAPASFKDASKISSWAKEDAEFMRSYGIFKGDEKGRLNPQKEMTRAEGAVALSRLFSAIMDEDIKPASKPESETKPSSKPSSGSTGSSSSSGSNSGSKEPPKASLEYEKGDMEDWTEEQIKEHEESLKVCEYCGGRTGRYHRWIGDVTCPNCGQFVKANTCHTCK